MSLLSRASLALAVSLMLSGAAAAQEFVIWSKDLTAAFAEAKAQKKILMVCINAKRVDGSTKIEPAAKGLREVVYKNARFVAKSREFVCAFLTPGNKSSEFGELRLLGIEGLLVSPQHIFVNPAGDTILLRREYWSHGKGEAAVNALLKMMDEAQAKLAGGVVPEAPKPSVKEAPTGDDRSAWIQERLRDVREGDTPVCLAAIDALIRDDNDGDCTAPLVLFLADKEISLERLVVIVRGMGRDKLFAGALPMSELLTHRKEEVRGNAAVSLEYIGSRDKKVVAALRRAADREKDEAIANHMYRALGRCGVGDGKARATLLKKCAGAKNAFATCGPAIGLAYFEGDKKAARGVEKMLKKIGIPGGRRGGGANIVKRGVLSWTLASIGDKKSGAFVREELLAKLENVKAFWVDGLKSFYATVARKCEGDDSALAEVEGSVRGFVSYAKGAGAEMPGLMDECRKDREAPSFTPKGEYLLGGGGDS